MAGLDEDVHGPGPDEQVQHRPDHTLQVATHCKEELQDGGQVPQLETRLLCSPGIVTHDSVQQN